MMEERVLFVDDDPNILEAYQRKFQHVLHVRTAEGALAGLREIQAKGPFAVVVADMNMPVMNGVEFLKKVREVAPQAVRMMLTGNSDIKIAMDAVNEGSVFRFLTKPCPSKLMAESLLAGIKQYRLVTAEKEVLEGTLEGTAELLIEVLSWTSPDAFGSALQLGNSAKVLAAELGVEDAWEIELAATLSQIGMLALPSEVLEKAGDYMALSSGEKRTLDSVPAIGHELLSHIPRLENVAKIILYQNKCFNGDGFPADEVSGNDIPVGSRILKIAGDYQALRASGLSQVESHNRMKAIEGLYDPVILSAFGKKCLVAATHGEKEQFVGISLKELTQGVRLASPIMTSEGRMLVSAGSIISNALLVRLRRYAANSGIKEPIEVLIHAQG